MRKRKWTVLLAALLAAVFMMSGCGSRTGGSSEAGAGNLFGQFEAELYGGGVTGDEIFAEADLTMVNIWATYCGYCIEEMPYFEKLAEEYGDDGFQMVGVITDITSPEDETAGQIIRETGASYDQIVFNETMWDTYLRDVQAVPTTVLVNREGEIVKEYTGAKDYEQWKEIIEELL